MTVFVETEVVAIVRTSLVRSPEATAEAAEIAEPVLLSGLGALCGCFRVPGNCRTARVVAILAKVPRPLALP
jgi:hypothetical protein